MNMSWSQYVLKNTEQQSNTDNEQIQLQHEAYTASCEHDHE